MWEREKALEINEYRQRLRELEGRVAEAEAEKVELLRLRGMVQAQVRARRVWLFLRLLLSLSVADRPNSMRRIIFLFHHSFQRLAGKGNARVTRTHPQPDGESPKRNARKTGCGAGEGPTRRDAGIDALAR